MDDKAKAFLDDLRRLMAAQGARFTRCEDGNGWWWQVSVGDSTLDLSDVDRYISAPANEQVEKVQATGNAMKTLADPMRKALLITLAVVSVAPYSYCRFSG